MENNKEDRMKKKFKLNAMDREVMENYGLDPKTYTLKELSLAHHAEAEKTRRIRLEIFIRSQSIEFVDFLEGRGEWNNAAGKRK
jgi:hypothetical protein